MKTLHLTLKKKWFDMIDSGEKLEEYREIKPYWISRLIDINHPEEQRGENKVIPADIIFDLDNNHPWEDVLKGYYSKLKTFDGVIFKNGYSGGAPLMSFRNPVITIGIGKPEWGAPSGRCFIIKLSEPGHYFPAGGHEAVRFDEDNVHGQCRYCNYFKHGNEKGYKPRLTTHSESRPKTKEYTIWAGIIQRCTDTNCNTYKWYGARGILVCDRWIHSYENFLKDMGRSPSASHSIDRIDSNGNYQPENCRWATWKEQQNNRRGNRILEYDGQTRTLSEWADKLNIKPKSLCTRLHRGWSIEESFNRPYRSINPRSKS